MAVADVASHSMPSTSTILMIAGAMAILFLGFLLREMCERLDLEFKGMYRRPAVVRVEYIRKPSLLLALPPELRNRIWEHSLVSREEVRIDNETWRQPPLLRACKQIRKEAAPMYYTLNKFSMVQTDLDFGPTVRFYRAARSTKGGNLRMVYFAGRFGQLNWDGLMKGAEAVHNGLIPLCNYNAKLRGAEAAAVGALLIAARLRGVRWAQVEEALKVYKMVVVDSGAGWKWV
ncbi:hypothetical protein LTR56_016561 [Elasticomyces elasticus]|nr:hypothetical protein LTR56_016561 [Elasticomyces elasticus]KAK3655904.1 hypothetical protein LTR22_010062 [Elasticomyces elasticus]KAK4909535.1 hypothetical protein LTR49_021703 [Elasticomyces elasticus]KAK5749193.1 hypothetical protein LTS12_020761 [Elasticomyces elasticus]